MGSGYYNKIKNKSETDNRDNENPHLKYSGDSPNNNSDDETNSESDESVNVPPDTVKNNDNESETLQWFR